MSVVGWPGAIIGKQNIEMFDKFGQPHGYGQDAPGRDAPPPQGLDAPKREQPLAQAISSGFGPSQYPTDPSMTAWRNSSGQPKPINQPLNAAIAPQSQGGLGAAPGTQQFFDNYFTQRGASTHESPYWVQKWPELEARGRELNDPDYAMKRLSEAESLGGGRSGAAPRMMNPLMSAIGGAQTQSGQPDAQHQHLYQLLQTLQQ